MDRDEPEGQEEVPKYKVAKTYLVSPLSVIVPHKIMER